VCVSRGGKYLRKCAQAGIYLNDTTYTRVKWLCGLYPC
jgi:hypothetical protein